jgi:hypothetical protein
MKTSISSLLALMGVCVPAAAITVTTPANGAQLNSPFWLVASAETCGGVTAVSMGHSIDHDRAVIDSTSFSVLITAAPGHHVLHVKCWGKKVHDQVLIDILVLSGPAIPANALSVDKIQTLSGWRMKDDPATPGAASGVMAMVTNPSLSGQAAQFETSFTNGGGVLYSVTYGNDPNPRNFVYDAQVWIEAGSQLSNLEMDNNQVTANGHTIIYAFQCAGDSNTWDYSENAGTPDAPVVNWVHSDQFCNPLDWTPNEWHHVQVSYSRDDAGNVTYHSVWLDGVEAPINQTVNSDFALGWASVLIANFQVDGLGASGSSILYLDDLTIYRW